MSDLQRSFVRAKIAGLPFEPPLPQSAFREEDEEEGDIALESEVNQDDDSSSASSASSTGTIIPSPSKHLFARPKGLSPGTRPLDPLVWSDFFSQELYLENHRPEETIIHHVYIIPPLAKGPLFVAHHGAGSSGLSFAQFASEIRRALPTAGVLSLDAREHGETVVTKSSPSLGGDIMDLSLPTLSQDLLDVILLTQKKMAWPELPGLLLIGHSLGGAVVTDVAAGSHLGNAILGYAVLDVVEGMKSLRQGISTLPERSTLNSTKLTGSAIDALQSMQSYLLTRPTSFPTLSAGIEWHTRSRTIRSSTSARISVPSLLRQNTHSSQPPATQTPWTWRTNLAATQPFWEGWFAGLSQKFLSAKGGKLLLLAGTDRLDKELMIGQMQGKYQLQVFPEAGHFIHEDQAEKTAMVLADFYRRNDRSALVLPPKVGALLVKQGEGEGGGL